MSIRVKKPSLSDVKNAVLDVQAVHRCPECMRHLEAIKQHRAQGHKP